MPRKAKAPKQYFPEVYHREHQLGICRTIFPVGGNQPICTGLTEEAADRIVALLNDTRTIPTVALKEHLVLSSLRFVEWLSKDDPRSDLNEEYSEEDQAHIGGARAIMDKHKFELPEE